MLSPQCLSYCDFVDNFETRICEYLKFVILQIVLAILSPVNFHMNFRITFSIYIKTANFDFDKYYAESGDQIWVIASGQI